MLAHSQQGISAFFFLATTFVQVEKTALHEGLTAQRQGNRAVEDDASEACLARVPRAFSCILITARGEPRRPSRRSGTCTACTFGAPKSHRRGVEENRYGEREARERDAVFAGKGSRSIAWSTEELLRPLDLPSGCAGRSKIAAAGRRGHATPISPASSERPPSRPSLAYTNRF